MPVKFVCARCGYVINVWRSGSPPPDMFSVRRCPRCGAELGVRGRLVEVRRL